MALFSELYEFFIILVLSRFVSVDRVYRSYVSVPVSMMDFSVLLKYVLLHGIWFVFPTVQAYFGKPLTHGEDDLFDVMGQATVREFDITDGKPLTSSLELQFCFTYNLAVSGV